MSQQPGNLQSVRSEGADQAIVFIHGFSGNRDDTWDRFPGLLGSCSPGWDIYTLGYASTFLPDVTGVWSADPDIPIIALMLQTRAGVEPLSSYRSLAFAAHSMGGLVAQQALLEDETLLGRINKLILFGTPSGGLKKAGFFAFWKRQIKNMASDSEFISDLRAQWNQRFATELPFDFLTVAGSRDQFVPPWSSLDPFPKDYHRVVPGDHLSMVKPEGAESESVLLLKSFLEDIEEDVAKTRNIFRLAAESSSHGISSTLQQRVTELTQSEVVDSALALERENKRDQAVELLEKHLERGTDVQGTLAGRMKRIWYETRDDHYARRALSLYEGALETARRESKHDQIYYQAINIAFLNFVAFDQPDLAKQHAREALAACEQANANVWNTATRAEAALYLGDPAEALRLYREVVKTDPDEDWKHRSAGLQATRIAGKLKDEALLDALDEIFTPNARQLNKIFVSYSHEDSDWKDRLCVHLKPYLRDGELELWVDDRIDAGDRWNDEIRQALDAAGVAVALVSANFLGSDFIHDQELPVIVDAANRKELILLWAHLSRAAYEQTPIKSFQAAYDPDRPLNKLNEADQEEALYQIAKEIKKATLGATETFRGHV